MGIQVSYRKGIVSIINRWMGVQLSSSHWMTMMRCYLQQGKDRRAWDYIRDENWLWWDPGQPLFSDSSLHWIEGSATWRFNPLKAERGACEVGVWHRGIGHDGLGWLYQRLQLNRNTVAKASKKYRNCINHSNESRNCINLNKKHKLDQVVLFLRLTDAFSEVSDDQWLHDMTQPILVDWSTIMVHQLSTMNNCWSLLVTILQPSLFSIKCHFPLFWSIFF